MIARALNSSHDLFSENGRIAIVQDVEEIAQHIKTRLLLVLGEYFLDITQGVPWFDVILTKPADLQEIETIIKNTILLTDGVNELLSFEMEFDFPTRGLTIDFSCNTDFGTLTAQEVIVNV